MKLHLKALNFSHPRSMLLIVGTSLAGLVLLLYFVDDGILMTGSDSIQPDIEANQAEAHQRDNLQSELDTLRKELNTAHRSLNQKKGEEELHQLQLALEKTRRELAYLQEQVTSLSADTATPLFDTTSGGQDLSQALEDLESARVHQAKDRAMQARAIEAHFEQEGVDRQWANDTAEVLQSSMDEFLHNSPETQAVVHNVECKTTICRVDLEDKDTMSFNMFLLSTIKAGGAAVSQAVVHSETDEEGRVHGTVYLTRRGHQLPSF